MHPTIAIVDYDSGNLRSAYKAFCAIAPNARVMVTKDAHDIDAATHVVIPGVGAFADCYQGLAALPQMVEALEKAVFTDKKPFLGICVGMQLLATVGYEHGAHKGLNWIAGGVKHLAPTPETLKIPHIGWNTITPAAPHPVLAGLPENPHFYFVHSYHFVPEQPQTILATTDYGGTFVSMLQRDNIVATQFHPEKSQGNGLKLLSNFTEWRP